MKLYPMKIKPHYQHRPWGGRAMKDMLNKDIPEGLIGETWEISAHPKGLSYVDNGPLKGMSLSEVVEKFGEDLMGSEICAKYEKSFPLLVKFLDVNDVLSVQVHPDDRQAQALENYPRGKAEAWYILNTKPGFKLYIGFKQGVKKDELVPALNEGRAEDLLNRIDVKRGDCIYLSPGTTHACGNGILMLEIQQSSDLTYRVYDWNRVDEKGRGRDLHTEKALKVIDFSKQPQVSHAEDVPDKMNMVLSCPHFDIYKVITRNRFALPAGDSCVAGTLTDGSCAIEYDSEKIKLIRGDSFVIPADLSAAIKSDYCEIIATIIK